MPRWVSFFPVSPVSRNGRRGHYSRSNVKGISQTHTMGSCPTHSTQHTHNIQHTAQHSTQHTAHSSKHTIVYIDTLAPLAHLHHHVLLKKEIENLLCVPPLLHRNQYLVPLNVIALYLMTTGEQQLPLKRERWGERWGAMGRMMWRMEENGRERR